MRPGAQGTRRARAARHLVRDRVARGTGDVLGERGSEEETQADDLEGQVDRAEDEDQKTKAK